MKLLISIVDNIFVVTAVFVATIVFVAMIVGIAIDTRMQCFEHNGVTGRPQLVDV